MTWMMSCHTPSIYVYYIYLNNEHLQSLFPVNDGTGILAFFSACKLAASLALAVKAVCGTSRGINGINLLPSISHSDIVFGPETLHRHSINSTFIFDTIASKNICSNDTMIMTSHTITYTGSMYSKI